METMMNKVTTYIGEQLPTVASFVLRVVICLAVFLIGRKVIAWAVRTVRQMMERAKIQTGAVTFTASVVKILLYAVLVTGIAMRFGLTESSVAALLASAGVAVGLALQGGLSNFAGGFLILFFKPFQVGDYIIAQGQEGTVYKIEILYTTLQTFDNRRVIIPNGTLANDVIVNVTAANKRKLEIKVEISYESSIARAKEILERLMQEDGAVLAEEEHQVFVAELAQNGVVVGLRCWVPTSQYMSVLWRMNEKIKEEFEKNRIRIPFQQVDVHIVQ